jgi:hypothetical protein
VCGPLWTTANRSPTGGRSALNLVDAADSVNSAIYFAEVSGWLVGAGEPPQSVAITADGVRLLEECGVI